MQAYKYPYIPKEYYAAVMFACKMIRETGYKNKAISTAANYYGVDEDEVRKHVEKRAVDRAKFNAVANEIGESDEWTDCDKMMLAVFVNELEEKLFGG